MAFTVRLFCRELGQQGAVDAKELNDEIAGALKGAKQVTVGDLKIIELSGSPGSPERPRVVAALSVTYWTE